MRQFPHRQPSSQSPALIGAAVALGALLAYALSSPRRRASLMAAGHSALEAGSRLATASAERLNEWMPERLHDSGRRFSTRAANLADSATSTAAGKLHSAVDVASEIMHQAVARARGLPAQAERATHAALGADAQGSDDGVIDDGRRSSALGPVIAVAALGAGLYAMRRRGSNGASGNGDGAVELDQTLWIDAPTEQVFDAWADYDNFPRFMSHVRSVQRFGADRSHWKVRGPAGIDVEFDSVAELQRPHQISWRSESGAMVDNSGQIVLSPENGGTRAQVRLTYRPPAGRIGEAVSSWLGADPRQEFEQDLERMKSFIEARRSSAPQSGSAATAATDTPSFTRQDR